MASSTPQKPASPSSAEEEALDAIGGERLTGSGFETEEPEPGFTNG